MGQSDFSGWNLRYAIKLLDFTSSYVSQLHSYMFINKYRENFTSDNNQMILQILIQEVKTPNETYKIEQIKGS